MTDSRWLQCVTPAPGDPSIQNRFVDLYMAAGAPEGCALFHRTSDDCASEVFLLTPPAARFASMLPGKWEEVANPIEYGWNLLVAAGDPGEAVRQVATREAGPGRAVLRGCGHTFEVHTTGVRAAGGNPACHLGQYGMQFAHGGLRVITGRGVALTRRQRWRPKDGRDATHGKSWLVVDTKTIQ